MRNKERFTFQIIFRDRNISFHRNPLGKFVNETSQGKKGFEFSIISRNEAEK
jgi:hypothetical protein